MILNFFQPNYYYRICSCLCCLICLFRKSTGCSWKRSDDANRIYSDAMQSYRVAQWKPVKGFCFERAFGRCTALDMCLLENIFTTFRDKRLTRIVIALHEDSARGSKKDFLLHKTHLREFPIAIFIHRYSVAKEGTRMLASSQPSPFPDSLKPRERFLSRRVFESVL